MRACGSTEPQWAWLGRGLCFLISEVDVGDLRDDYGWGLRDSDTCFALESLMVLMGDKENDREGEKRTLEADEEFSFHSSYWQEHSALNRVIIENALLAATMVSNVKEVAFVAEEFSLLQIIFILSMLTTPHFPSTLRSHHSNHLKTLTMTLKHVQTFSSTLVLHCNNLKHTPLPSHGSLKPSELRPFLNHTIHSKESGIP